MEKYEKAELLKSLFREYYSSKFQVEHVWEMDKREFAFQPFQEDVMLRHLAFTNPSQLKSYIEDLTPKHAYYSTALYVDPSIPDMEAKNWIGAELVFDIDADHILTSCKLDHDAWKCLECGSTGRGEAVENCPTCGSSRVESYTWVCQECIEAAKNHTLRLVEEFLVSDFGIDPKNVQVYFSGHRGFHVHVLERDYLKLGGEERREIVNYVKGLGLDFKSIGVNYGRSSIPILALNDYGWRGKIARGVYDFLASTSREELVRALKSVEAAEEILKHKSELLELLAGSYEEVYKAIMKIKTRNFIKLAKRVLESLRVEVDEKVTIDVKRLIRMPNTLNGKTGLKVVKVDLSKLESFQLTPELSPFQGVARVKFLKDTPVKLKIFNEEFKSVRGDILKVSMPAAVYLAAKGYVEVLEVIS